MFNAAFSPIIIVPLSLGTHHVLDPKLYVLCILFYAILTQPYVEGALKSAEKETKAQ